jgi:PKD repeat protein
MGTSYLFGTALLLGTLLMITGALATDSANLTISGTVIPAGGPVADFSVTPTTGLAPLTVQFTDSSRGNPTSWFWDFGDGGTSTLRNPVHTFARAGAFTVSLTAENSAGSSMEVKPTCVLVSYRLNCGAPKTVYTDTSGKLWPKDQRYSSGGWGWVTISSTGRTRQPIGNTLNDPLYQEWRYVSGVTLTYRFTVRNGDFRVTTMYLEPDYNDNRRIFDILMENAIMTAGYRPFTASGGRYRADEEVHIISVTDGILDLQLRPLQGANKPNGRNNPIIAAVEVTPWVT